MYLGFNPSPYTLFRVLPLEKGEISSLFKGSPEIRGDGLKYKYTFLLFYKVHPVLTKAQVSDIIWYSKGVELRGIINFQASSISIQFL